MPVCSGVPQGSVLSRSCFRIHINDIPDTVTSKARLLADNTALYLAIEDEKDSATLQRDLDKLSVWERDWDMEFNPSKCQVIQVTGSRKPNNANNSIHGHVLAMQPKPLNLPEETPRREGDGI